MSVTTRPTTADLESNGAWQHLLDDILPPQGEWSEEEYLVLTNHRTRLIEYTDGFLEALPMPTAAHQLILGNLYLIFATFFKALGGKVVFAPLRLQVRPRKYREPDLLLLLSAVDPRGQNRYWLGADLVLEVVSEDKPERDLIDKRFDYAEANVPEYWIVDPRKETITVLKMDGGAYAESGCYRRGDRAHSVLRPEFSVAVADVFDAANNK